MESSQDFVPLILLTADRPPELLDCGANQAIDQVRAIDVLIYCGSLHEYINILFGLPVVILIHNAELGGQGRGKTSNMIFFSQTGINLHYFLLFHNLYFKLVSGLLFLPGSEMHFSVIAIISQLTSTHSCF